MNKLAIKIWVFFIMSKNVNFGPNAVVGTGAGFHGVESRVEGTAAAAQGMVANNAFGQTGDLNFFRNNSVPDGDAVTGDLMNSNKWNIGETRSSRAAIARANGAGGSRRHKSKQRKSRKSNKSKKRKSRKANRRRR
jgi:hypothetical protein